MYAIRSYYGKFGRKQLQATPAKCAFFVNIVITSYSIHYTKLYDALNAFAGEWLKLFDAVTVGYEDNLEAELAMANGILGGIGFNGELPVSCGPFLAGTGFETHENQVPFTNTAFEGFNQNMTSRIDSLSYNFV